MKAIAAVVSVTGSCCCLCYNVVHYCLSAGTAISVITTIVIRTIFKINNSWALDRHVAPNFCFNCSDFDYSYD